MIQERKTGDPMTSDFSTRPVPPVEVAILTDESVFEQRCRELADLGIECREQPLEQLAGGARWRLCLPSEKDMLVRITSNPRRLIEWLEDGPVGAVLIDNRRPDPPASFAATVAGAVLPELLSFPASRKPLSRRTILVVLSEDARTAHHAYAVGSLQLGGVVVDGPLEAALEAALKIARPAIPGKAALCLAGGGIEGMLFELGVIQAIEDHLKHGSLVDFDIFSGISAGAILCTFLANGVRPHELVDMLNNRPSRISPLTRSMLFDPNLKEVAGRFAVNAAGLLRGRGGWLKNPIDNAMRFMPTGVFSGDKIRWYLERELTKPGMTNDFNQLRKQLYIGVTDQDTGEHVTFGEKGRKNVPISHAVRASTSMTPYYPPERIGGRYFIDGIFTRTINLDVAVEKGARLIIVVDPLTPFKADQPGYVSGRGGFFNTVQSVKAIIRTRFSEVIERAQEAYPDVAIYEFSPGAKDLEKVSGTMMRYFFSAETVDMAYDSACEQIEQTRAWLKADLDRHGFKLKGS